MVANIVALVLRSRNLWRGALISPGRRLHLIHAGTGSPWLTVISPVWVMALLIRWWRLLLLPIVPALLIAAIWLFLLCVLRVVLRCTMAKGRAAHPAGAVEWLCATSAAASCRNTTEDEEEKNESYDDDGKSNPAAPVVPGILRVND